MPLPSALPHASSGVLPAAVLWDYDGTLVDTEKIWVESEHAALADFGAVWSDEQGAALAGSTWEVSTAAMLHTARSQGIEPPGGCKELYLRMHTWVAAAIRAGEIPWLPGAEELLREVHARGVPNALVSASPRDVLDASFGRTNYDLFDTVVDGLQTTRGKPDPQSYLLAAQQLGVSPEQCLVVEDSVPGCAAGVNAGAVVLAVPLQGPVPPLPHQVIRANGLVGLRWADLQAIYADQRAADRSGRL